jgi:hypothetical protein
MEVRSSSDSSVRVWPRYMVAYQVTQPMVLTSRADGSFAAQVSGACVGQHGGHDDGTDIRFELLGRVRYRTPGWIVSESSRPPESIDRHARRLLTHRHGLTGSAQHGHRRSDEALRTPSRSGDGARWR